MPKRKTTFDPELATEAKSIVALAFRNGPIEDIHVGKECTLCAGKPEYSHITQDEMKHIMKQAVDTVYNLLWLKENDPEKYAENLELGSRYTRLWDNPSRRHETSLARASGKPVNREQTMDRKTAAQIRALILAEDPAEILRLETAIKSSQVKAVDLVIQNSRAALATKLSNNRGTFARRLAAARQIVQEPVFDPSLLTPLENDLMFALAYVAAFIDDSTDEGKEAKKLAVDNLKAARTKGEIKN